MHFLREGQVAEFVQVEDIAGQAQGPLSDLGHLRCSTCSIDISRRSRPSSTSILLRTAQSSTAHSRFVAGVVQANTLHPDFQPAARSADARLAYAALLIGKESIAFNDRSGSASDFLEKLLDFYFKLNARKPKRGARQPKPIGPEQERLAYANVAR